jgi:hypothetical protein
VQDGPLVHQDDGFGRWVFVAGSGSFVDQSQIRDLARDLDQQRIFIVNFVTPADPDLALDLIWRFLELAEPTFERCDDGTGAIANVFQKAVDDLGKIAVTSSVDPKILADSIVTRLQDDGYGVYDSLTASLIPALGQTGVARLKEHVYSWKESLEDEISSAGDVRPSSGTWRRHSYAIEHCLQTLADAEGDVDAFIATHDDRALSNPVFVARIAHRLIAADRADEAVVFLDRATPKHEFGLRQWHDVRIEALRALDNKAEVQALRWHMFQTTLQRHYLRDYLDDLPAFDDVEAEEKALTWVESVDDVHQAAAFFIDWPDFARAARLVVDRHAELDGNLYDVLDPAADVLEGNYPLAAILLRRALVEHTLDRAKSTRYKHAARNIRHLADLAKDVVDMPPHENHDEFIERLRKKHPRTTGFWSLVV